MPLMVGFVVSSTGSYVLNNEHFCTFEIGYGLLVSTFPKEK